MEISFGNFVWKTDRRTERLVETPSRSLKSSPIITMDAMENRNCKKGDTRGYFKQDNKTDTIDYGTEHTGDNVCYSGNKLLRKKDISGLLSKFRN